MSEAYLRDITKRIVKRVSYTFQANHGGNSPSIATRLDIVAGAGAEVESCKIFTNFRFQAKIGYALLVHTQELTITVNKT